MISGENYYPDGRVNSTPAPDGKWAPSRARGHCLAALKDVTEVPEVPKLEEVQRLLGHLRSLLTEALGRG